MNRPQHIAGKTYHGRKGGIRNAFTYGVDYVLIDPDSVNGPGLFSRNGFNLLAVHDRNHGGLRGAGQGVAWAREALAQHGARVDQWRIRLLTQPSILGYLFNPVSFWLAFDDNDSLRAVIAEVNNTFGDRHSYLCALPDFAPISPQQVIAAEKIFHVSPFQKVEGQYRFRFDVTDHAIDIVINYENGTDGVIATLKGPRKPLTNSGILLALLRRPFGAARVIALIYWQALKLKFKGARYRTRPEPPETELSPPLAPETR